MDAPDYYCLCGSTHVLTGTKWIGLGGAGVCAFWLFCAVLRASAPMALLAVATVPFYMSLLYAYHKHKPRLYLPFLVVNGLEMALCWCYALFVLAMFVWMPDFWHRHMARALREHPHVAANKMRQHTALLLAFVTGVVALLCWFQTVVLRAYQYMCLEQHTLIPPQLHPAFVLTKVTKLDMAEDGQQGHQRHPEEPGAAGQCERESRLA